MLCKSANLALLVQPWQLIVCLRHAMQVVSQMWRQRYLHAFVAMGTPW